MADYEETEKERQAKDEEHESNMLFMSMIMTEMPWWVRRSKKRMKKYVDKRMGW